MKFKMSFLVITVTFLSSLSFAVGKIKTVENVDVSKFVGAWYRVSANSVIFEPKCACARQVLALQNDGKISVYNSCNKGTAAGKLVEISGTATAKDSTASKLKVDFGLPWKGSYWIVAVDTYYRYAVVSDAFGYSLYVMSRTPTLDSNLYSEAVQAAKDNGVNVNRLLMQSHEGCSYPSEN